MHEELASAHKFHDEVDSLAVLEDELHANEERMVGLLQNFLLEQRRLDLVELEDGVFAQGLHGVQVARVSLLDEEHLAEATLSDDGFQVEVLQCCGFLCRVTDEEGHSAVLAHLGLLHLNIELHLGVHTGRHGWRLLRLRTGSWLRLRCCLIVDVFLRQAVLGIWQDPVAVFGVLLARVAALQSVVHAINGQILLVVLEGLILDGLKDLVSALALESVVVLVLHMHHELEALVLSATRDGLDAANGYSTLHASILQVVQGDVCEEQHASLTHGPLVVLDDLAREDDLLASCKLGSDA